MKLVTFNDGRVGRIRDGKTIEELDVPSMRDYFEGGESAQPTGKTFLLDDVRLRAPIVPKKFFHTAGNYQEHHEESLRVGWSHPVRPWIVFFQTSMRSSVRKTRSSIRNTSRTNSITSSSLR